MNAEQVIGIMKEHIVSLKIQNEPRNVKEAVALRAVRDASSYRKWNYEQMEAYSVAINALEKQMPRKVNICKDAELPCPACGESLGYWVEGNDTYGYCTDCGQKIQFVKS